MSLFGWIKEMATRRKKAEDKRLYAAALAAHPPDGSVELCTLGAPQRLADQSGRIMLILTGTFAANAGVALLALLARCGMAGIIGSVLLLEADERIRARFLYDMPSIFLDRLVAPTFPGLSGGFGNANLTEVRSAVRRWGPSVSNGAVEVCELHQRRQFGSEAALVLVFVSEGGQSLIGTKAVETVRKLFKMARFFGFSALPVDDRLRVRVEPVLEAYRAVGVHGFVLSDNLADPVRNDFGMLGAIAGFASAAEAGDAATESNNAWYLLFREAPGGLVSYSTYVRSLPGYQVLPWHVRVRRRYYTPRDAVISGTLTGLEEVDDDQYHALRGYGRDGHEPLTSRFDIVVVAVAPEALKRDEDDIVLGQYLAGKDKRNYHLLFAPITTDLDPAKPACPLAVIALHAVHDVPGTLSLLTTPIEDLPQLSGASPEGQLATQPAVKQSAEESRA